jgi:hypothetical protein
MSTSRKCAVKFKILIWVRPAAEIFCSRTFTCPDLARIPLSAEITAELIHTLPASPVSQTDRRSIERDDSHQRNAVRCGSRVSLLGSGSRDEGIAEGPARYLVSVLLRPLSRLIKLKFI